MKWEIQDVAVEFFFNKHAVITSFDASWDTPFTWQFTLTLPSLASFFSCSLFACNSIRCQPINQSEMIAGQRAKRLLIHNHGMAFVSSISLTVSATQKLCEYVPHIKHSLSLAIPSPGQET
jgi:hypothetical protein